MKIWIPLLLAASSLTGTSFAFQHSSADGAIITAKKELAQAQAHLKELLSAEKSAHRAVAVAPQAATPKLQWQVVNQSDDQCPNCQAPLPAAKSPAHGAMFKAPAAQKGARQIRLDVNAEQAHGFDFGGNRAPEVRVRGLMIDDKGQVHEFGDEDAEGGISFMGMRGERGERGQMGKAPFKFPGRAQMGGMGMRGMGEGGRGNMGAMQMFPGAGNDDCGCSCECCEGEHNDARGMDAMMFGGRGHGGAQAPQVQGRRMMFGGRAQGGTQAPQVQGRRMMFITESNEDSATHDFFMNMGEHGHGDARPEGGEHGGGNWFSGHDDDEGHGNWFQGGHEGGEHGENGWHDEDGDMTFEVMFDSDEDFDFEDFFVGGENVEFDCEVDASCDSACEGDFESFTEFGDCESDAGSCDAGASGCDASASSCDADASGCEASASSCDAGAEQTITLGLATCESGVAAFEDVTEACELESGCESGETQSFTFEVEEGEPNWVLGTADTVSVKGIDMDNIDAEIEVLLKELGAIEGQSRVIMISGDHNVTPDQIETIINLDGNSFGSLTVDDTDLEIEALIREIEADINAEAEVIVEAEVVTTVVDSEQSRVDELESEVADLRELVESLVKELNKR